MRHTNTWLLDKHYALTPAELSTFIDVRREALRHEALNIEMFASAALPTHPELQPDLSRHLAPDVRALARLAEKGVYQLAIDQDFARPIVEHVVIEMDGGATLKIPSDRYHELVTIEPGRTPENKTRIVIETLSFKEVIDR